MKVGAHVAAAVLYQCFTPEEFKYGLRMLQLSPESHDEAFFQYFWEVRALPVSAGVLVWPVTNCLLFVSFCAATVLGATLAFALEPKALQQQVQSAPQCCTHPG